MRSLKDVRGGPCPKCGAALLSGTTSQCANCGWSEARVPVAAHENRKKTAWSPTKRMRVFGCLHVCLGAVNLAAGIFVAIIAWRFAEAMGQTNNGEEFGELVVWFLAVASKVVAVLAIVAVIFSAAVIVSGIGLLRGRQWGLLLTALLCWADIVLAAAVIAVAPLHPVAILSLLTAGYCVTVLVMLRPIHTMRERARGDTPIVGAASNGLDGDADMNADSDGGGVARNDGEGGNGGD